MDNTNITSDNTETKIPAFNNPTMPSDNNSDSDLEYEDCQAFLGPSAFVVPKINLPKSRSYLAAATAAAATAAAAPLPGTSGLKSAQDKPQKKESPAPSGQSKPLNPNAKPFFYKPSPGNSSSPLVMAGQWGRRGSEEQDSSDVRRIQAMLATQKVLVLMRGCPGSGKSTLAKKLVENLPTLKSSIILSTDSFFGQSTEYHYDRQLLPIAHSTNQRRAESAMSTGTDLVVIDNTNIHEFEMLPYANMAIKHCYSVQILEPNTEWKFKSRRLANLNIHGVPKEKIDFMLREFRPITAQQLVQRRGGGFPQQNRSQDPANKTSINTNSNNNPNTNSYNKTPIKTTHNNNNSKKTANKRSRNNRSPTKKFLTPTNTEMVTDANIGSIEGVDNIDTAFPISLTDDTSSDRWGSESFWEDPEPARDHKHRYHAPRGPVHVPESESVSDHEHLAESISALSLQPAEAENSKDTSSTTSSGHSSRSGSLQLDSDECSLLSSVDVRSTSGAEKLEWLSLQAILKLNDEDIRSVADEVILAASQRRDCLLTELFQKRIRSTQPLPSPEYQSSNVTQSSSSNELAVADSSAEDDTKFYVDYCLQQDFLLLLTHLFGPIQELENKKADQNGLIHQKLAMPELKLLYDTLTKICQPKDCQSKQVPQDSPALPPEPEQNPPPPPPPPPHPTVVESGLKPGRRRKGRERGAGRKLSPAAAAASARLPVGVQSLAEIMKEQQVSQIELALKLKRNDSATADKLRQLCSCFPGCDPLVIESVFKENDYNYTTTLAILSGKPIPDPSILYSDCPEPVLTENKAPAKPKICDRVRFVEWIKVDLYEDYEATVEFFQQRFSDANDKKDLYRSHRLCRAKQYNNIQASKYKSDLIDARLKLLKQRVAQSLTPESYNVVDLHGMTRYEAPQITLECIRDYEEALAAGYDLKRSLQIITGKGLNNNLGVSLIKPPVVSKIKSMSYNYVDCGGSLTVIF